MRKTKQPPGLAEGIYFNLSNEAYHADPALSHSGMTQVLVSWADYWVRSPLNPKRKEYKPSDAMIFGDRCHQYLLEGKDFFKRYNVRGMAYDPKKTPVSTSEFEKIRASVEAITTIPGMAEHFTVGCPEVSIFWKDPTTGIMLRARYDYLYVFGALDYKRIKGMDDYTIGRAVRDQGLDIQHAHYCEGIRAIRRKLRAGKAVVDNLPEVIGGEPGQVWLDAFMNEKAIMYRFLFQRSTPPFIWEFRELEAEPLREGEDAVRIAIQRYSENLAKYGIGCPPLGHREVKTISTYHIPRRNYD